jgi:glycosyltransferase involved in cell wall biosynthesis
MEILFISHKHPPATGGMERQSFELVQHMRRYAKVHTLVYEGRGSRLAFFLTLNKRIVQICHEHPGIELIHFNDGLIAAASLLHHGYRYLKRAVTLHGLDIVFPGFIYRRFIVPRFSQFDIVIAVSNAAAKAAVTLGVDSKKLVVINNGVDDSIAGMASRHRFLKASKKYGLDIPGKKILMAMGRPVQRKGFSWFVREVLPLLDDEFIVVFSGPFSAEKKMSSRFLKLLPSFLRRRIELFLGFPSDEKQLKKLLKHPGISRRVRHLGLLPFDEVTALLSGAAAFIMPNIAVEGDMEGFGLVCLEAALCGTPVFAANIDGIPDAVHNGKNGFLLPTGDAQSWAKALQNYFKDDVQATTALLQRQQIVSYTRQHFSWDKMANQYACYFEQLLAHQNQHAATPLKVLV